MYKTKIISVLSDIVGADNIILDEPMKKHTSLKCGGPADILLTPEDNQSLYRIIQACKDEDVPVIVMGNGTNLLVRDKGIRGVVIKLCEKFSEYSVKDDTIEAQSGILVSKLSKIALENELSGMEFAEGIPGTLGGAVAMNAGAYNGDMSGIIIKTNYIDKEGQVKTLEGLQHQFGKRTSFIQKEGGIVLNSKIQLRKGCKQEIRELMRQFREQRREKQPLELPSAGSVFKRPEGHFAGKLIQDCGLKGYRIGGAEISKKHCGFITNPYDATSSDVLKLIEYIQQKVKLEFGVELQTEVRIIGEE